MGDFSTPYLGAETAKEMRGTMHRKRLTKAMATVMLSVTMAVGTMPAMPVFAQENVAEETQITADVSKDESTEQSGNTVTDEVTEGASDSTIPEKATDEESDDTKAVVESTDAADITDTKEGIKDTAAGVSDKSVAEKAENSEEDVSLLKAAGDTVWQNDYNYSKYTEDHLISIYSYKGDSDSLTIPSQAIIEGQSYDVRVELNFLSPYYRDMCQTVDIVSITVKPGAEIKGHLGGNTTIETVDLSGTVMASTDMIKMFGGCTNLKSVNLSGMDTSNVTDMSQMFRGCSSLTDVDLSGIDTENVENFRTMFEGCSSLYALDLSSFTIRENARNQDFLRNCSNLKYIKTPGKVVYDRFYLITEDYKSGIICVETVDESYENYGYYFPVIDHSIILKTRDAKWADCPWPNNGSDGPPALAIKSASYDASNGDFSCVVQGSEDKRIIFYRFRNGKLDLGSGPDDASDLSLKYHNRVTWSTLGYRAGEYKWYLLAVANRELENDCFNAVGKDLLIEESDLVNWLNSKSADEVVYETGTFSYGERPRISSPAKLDIVEEDGKLYCEISEVENAIYYDSSIAVGINYDNPDTCEVLHWSKALRDAKIRIQDEEKARSYDQIIFMVHAIGDLTVNDVSEDTILVYSFKDKTVGGDPASKTGLYQEADGSWSLYINGVFASDYSDLYYDKSVGWWKVLNGKVDFDYTDLYHSPTVGWWKINDGKVDYKYNDLYDSPTYGLWYVNNGYISLKAKGLIRSDIFDDVWQIENSKAVKKLNSRDDMEPTVPDGLKQESDGSWSLYLNGKVATDFTDLYCDTNVGWWLVSNGKVDFGYNGLFGSDTYGWWKIRDGAVDFGYSDLYDAPDYGWWKISGGAVDFGFTGAYESPTYGAWMIESGRVTGPVNSSGGNTAINGLAPATDGTWYLYDNGQVASGYSALYYDENYGWWLIDNGRVAFDYNGLYCDPTLGWWLITGGAVNFEYNDLYGDANYGWWKIAGGAVDFGFTDLYCSNTYGWWLVEGGAVAFGYDDLFGSPIYGWWKVTGGAVDFGFTDLFCSPSCGWWLVNGGAVAFGYTDLFYSPTYGWWKINDGCVDFGYKGLYNSPTFGEWNISGGAVVFVNN